MQIKIPNDIDTSYFDESQGRTLSVYLNPETGELWDRVSIGNGGVPECVWHQRHLHVYSTRTHTYGPDTWADALEHVKDDIAGLLDFYQGLDYDSRSNYVGMWDEEIEYHRYKVEEKLEEYLQSCINESFWQPDEWLQCERGSMDGPEFWLYLCERANVKPDDWASAEQIESFLLNGDNVVNLHGYLIDLFGEYEVYANGGNR